MRISFLGILAAAVLSLTSFVTEAEANAFGPLVSAEELAAAQASVKPLILDIRGKAVQDGFIEGAVSVGYGAFRGPKDNPGKLVGEAELTSLFRRLGLTADRPTVIVFQGKNETDFGAAARVYWTLKSAGLSQISILNGGMNAWTADASRKTVPAAAQPVPSDITVSFNQTWLATRADVKAIVDGQQSARLIDARPPAFFNGDKQHPAAARPGTLPQSEYFVHSGWFAKGPAVVDGAAAKQLAAKGGFSQGENLVSFCNTGHWAATNWFALSELAGIEEVKLYPESMVGWSHAGLPMANTPGILKNFWNRITQ